MMLTDIPLGAKHHYPIFDAAAESRLPVVVHPTGAEGLYSGTAPFAGGTPRSYAEWHALAPQVGQSALASLVFSGALETFPDLRVVFTEYGFSWLPTLLWRLDMEWRNFRGDVPWMKMSPSDYVRRQVRFTTQPMEDPDDPRDLLGLLRLMDAEHLLLFSSDYPHYDEDNPEVVSARFPPEIRERVKRLNALEILRLPVRPNA
jgi:predicted TIM-barrel fold metal-dependent hydrolase